MQHDHPLTVTHILDRMRRLYADSEVVTLRENGVTRASYGDVAARVDRLARALTGLGIGPADRVATFAWNSQEHLEVYLAAPSMGAVLHTLNIRLAAEQLTYIANHAEDKVVFVDDSLVALLEPLVETFETVEHFV
ncbi:MAG: long-chain fatty acid--CoA ligase, partial [Solirubrobacterales bacterium]|nr:long-chain fatty acid--CoA ligase [Solirubrobacterales bacterium]